MPDAQTPREGTERARKRRLVVAIAFATGLAGPAAADTVRLANGDRISGTVVRKAGDTLTIKTEYAGELKIRWADIVEVRTDAPTKLLLKDGTTRETTRLEAEPAAGTDAVGLDRVEYVNPTPGEAGTGIDYSGHVTLAATATSGNSENSSLYGEAELRGRSVSRRFVIFGNATEASSGDERTASNWRVNANHDWFLRPQHFVYVRGGLEHDEFRDIDLRATGGGGYGYQFFDTPDLTLSLQGGLDYVVTDYSAAEDEDSLALGWGLRYRQWLWSRRAQVFFDQDGYYELEGSDVIVNTRTGLRVPLVDKLNFTAQLNLDWDSEPAPGRKSTDATWILGLGYAW